jgi:biopolymer transport protein ExbB/TolQ
LLFMSIICWTLFIYKMIMIRSRLRDLNNALRQLQAVRNADNLITIATALQGTVPGAILASSLSMLSSLLDIKPAQAADILQYHIDQTVDTLMADEESSLPILSTSAAVSPLLGLFGTVWGLIHAFISISEKQSADITVVAPGMAEALITTLAGLMVAIPALIMYNILAMNVRRVEAQITQFADKVSFIVQPLVGK